MSDELKPCNYCEDGGEPRIVYDGFFHVAGCHECGFTIGAYLTKESAIAAWNTRVEELEPDSNLLEPKRCELEETESYDACYVNHGNELEMMTVHILECSECGEECEHVNGTYERCPHCGAANVLDENYADDAPEQPVDNAQADSRSKLEADVADIVGAEPLYATIIDWLDRQAAITRFEVFEDGEFDCMTCGAKRELHKQVDSLTAEVEAQRKRANDAERGVLSDEWYVCRDRYEDDIAELTAECDGLKARVKLQQSQIDAGDLAFEILTHEYGKLDRKCDELKAERDELRERLGAMTAALDLERIDELQAKVDSLTAERDKWASNAETGFKRIKELEAERDELQSIINHMPKTEAECEACQEAHDRLMFNAKVHQDELRDELKHKQLVIDRQRDSFSKMERECAELRRMLADAAEAI